MSSQDDIKGVSPIRYFIPPGASLALLVEAVPGQNGTIISYQSGGSVSIVMAGATVGGTYTAAQLGSVYDGATARYDLASNQSVNLGGAARFYALAIGTTGVLQVIRALGPGF